MEEENSENEDRLDEFFKMFDAVEEDISELVSDENEEPPEIGGYECLLIAFSNLRLYCESIGIRLLQIEEQYQELKKSEANEEFGTFAIPDNIDDNNEIVNFCKLMELVENSLTTLEKRREKSGEVFDDWTCVLLMYSYLRSYCDKEKIDFVSLQEEIRSLHAEMEKNANPETNSK